MADKVTREELRAEVRTVLAHLDTLTLAYNELADFVAAELGVELRGRDVSFGGPLVRMLDSPRRLEYTQAPPALKRTEPRRGP